MKKRSMIVLCVFVLFLGFFSCKRMEEPRPSLPGITDTVAISAASPEITQSSLETPEPTDALEINSAVAFLNNPCVISKDTKDAKRTRDPESLNPGDIYVGGTANDQNNNYDLLILDKEQSLKILTASDITKISYQQSECLPIMLRWDDVSILDMYRYYKNSKGRTCKAYFYYLYDSTVIIVNDSVMEKNKENNAWILVIPKEENQYASWIPPKGTFTGHDELKATLYEPYYDCIRNYFLKESYSRRGLLEPEYESFMINYTEWMKWREDHTDYYETWKQLSYPEKITQNDYSDEGVFRVNYIDWCNDFGTGNELPIADDRKQSDYLPAVYYQINKYGIPREEMMEYVKWMRWSGYYHILYLNEEDVEILYSGDEESIRQSLIAQRATYFEGKIYKGYDVLNWLPAYNIAWMYTREQFREKFFYNTSTLRLDHNYPAERTLERIDRICRAWDEYEKIRGEDSGPLTIASALRVLTDFMKFYEEVKYSPDVLASESATIYDKNFFSYDERTKSLYLSNKSFMELREEMYCIFAPELCELLNATGDGYETVFYSRQFSFLLWEGVKNPFLVSNLPKYYNGLVELFDEDYRLEDHIIIESSEDEYAVVTMTAKGRSGTGERLFTAEFTKVGGRWLISGGTITELIAPVE